MSRLPLILIILALTSGLALAQDGAAIYKQRCAACHDTPVGRVPPVSALRAMDAAAISRSLESGPMQTQAAGLTAAERDAVVAYLAPPKQTTASPAATEFLCQGATTPISPAARWTGWGVNLANTRFQDTTAAGIAATDVPKLKLKWAFALGQGTAVRSQPAVADGRLFTADLTGLVYALDAKTGCQYWSFKADSPVRSGIVFNDAGSAGPAIYFGDLKGNVYAVNATSGQLLWKVHAAEHFAAMVTGTPQVHGGVAYVPFSSFEEILPPNPKYECCTFRGSVVALDASSGKLLWRTYTIQDAPQPTTKSKAGTQLHGPSGAGVWSTPTLDEKAGVLYVATGDNYSEPATKTSDAVLALDVKTGKIIWSKQVTANDVFNNGCVTPDKPNCPETSGKDSDFGQPPILISLGDGHRALVIGQKSGVVHALDPDREGQILWQMRVGQGGYLGGIQWGSASDGENVYVALSDLQFAPVADPSAPNGFRLGLDPNHGGGLFALKIATGEKVWSAKPPSCGERKNCSPAQSAAVAAIPGMVFSGSEDGHLRAYAAATGEVVWDVDTVRDYDTVNRAKARGGSLDVAGPVIAGGMLYVNSGYGQWGGAPGNVLLAFSIDGK
ncbi:MAG: PQQ-binding-like beta-propeller repeat protein [Bryobacteraceae bacterium]